MSPVLTEDGGIIKTEDGGDLLLEGEEEEEPGTGAGAGQLFLVCRRRRR